MNSRYGLWLDSAIGGVWRKQGNEACTACIMALQSPDRQLARIRAIARTFDSAIEIPGTRFRFGLDPIIGLIPGIGDLASDIASIYIVLVGIRLGAPRSVVVRMLANIGIDTIIGSVPVLGDIFDAGWKSNNMNVALIERHVGHPDETQRSSRWIVAAVAAVLLILAIGGLVVTVWAIRRLSGR